MYRNNRRDPHRDTDPESVSLACRNGYSANPMYLHCDICPNFDKCPVRISLKIDKIIRESRPSGLGVPYDPDNPPEDWQFDKYFSWTCNRLGEYDMTGSCVFGDPPRDSRGHLFCQQSCPILRSQEVYCLVAAKEMNARDTDRRCRRKVRNHLEGWEKVFVDPETGYYCDIESNRPKSRKLTRSNYFWMAFWAIIFLIAWLKS